MEEASNLATSSLTDLDVFVQGFAIYEARKRGDKDDRRCVATLQETEATSHPDLIGGDRPRANGVHVNGDSARLTR